MDGGVVQPIAVGTKEIEDLIAAANAAVDQVAAAVADGKVSTVEVLTMLVSLSGPLKDALEGVSKIPAEVKDIDQAEAQKLVGQLFALGVKIVDAFKK